MRHTAKLKKFLVEKIPILKAVQGVLYKYKPYQAKFRTYYLDEGWKIADSLSGVDASEATKKQLSELLQRLNISILIDAPCGDFYWMKDVNLTGIQYLGLDIVPEIIADNNLKYQKENITFAWHDLTKQTLPKGDLVLCRDFFNHYPNTFIFQSIKNIKESSSEYLLATTFTRLQVNSDIDTPGIWRPINFQLPPFNFPNPIQIIIEEDIRDGKGLGLWKLKDLTL